MKEKRNKGDIFISLWIALGVIIILGFFVFSMIIGGSAGNGYQENGQYFVRDHSEIVEVSKTLWVISSVWGILFWIFIPLTPIGAFAIAHLKEKIKQRKIDSSKENQVFRHIFIRVIKFKTLKKLSFF